MKKKKILQNNNGVVICDSIVMSVKKKRPDTRKPEAIIIAIIGYISVIMSFLGMFSFNYNKNTLILASAIASLFYIILSVVGKHALCAILISMGIFVATAYRFIDSIAMGFKFMYNIIYSDSYHTEINYYKSLPPDLETQSVTVLFVFVAWLLAMIIYFFTIYHPNPILPLISTFPIIEAGLYNGIEIPVFWGVMTVAYWLALLSMSTIDVGEINGGNGGFVRKDNTFFPKRQMRLKVTEKCGLFLILLTLVITAVASAFISVSDYKRSDELNRKRVEIRDAINSFSVENLAESVSRLTSAFGFSFKYDRHRLGTTDRLKYKNTTDLNVNIDRITESAIYLKEYTGAVYSDNEWTDLSDSVYKNPLFTDFKNYGVYPQDFASLFGRNAVPDVPTANIRIKSKLKDDKSFAPYGTDNFGNLTYNFDMTVSSKRKDENEFSYKFILIPNDVIARNLGESMQNTYSVSGIANAEIAEKVSKYCTENGLFVYDDVFNTESEMPFDNDSYTYSNGNVILGQLFQTRYKEFVYKNYLQVPDNENMQEVREAYGDILQYTDSINSAQEKLEILTMIRDRIGEENEYSLSPGKTPANRDFVNYFLLENHKGYCIHYATSGVMLARMAGIPARYATGYVIVGEDFNNSTANSDGTYTIDVKDNRSHAWAEVYLDGYGWIPFEFTAGYSDMSIATETTAPPTPPETETTAFPTESDETTTRQSSRRTGTRATTTTVTTTVTGTKNVRHVGHGTKKQMPKTVKNILAVIFITGGAVLMVYGRRRLIIYSRNRKFNSGESAEEVTAMYNYAEKLLKSQKISKDELSFKDFAELAEKEFGGRIFADGAFSAFMDISLKAGFSSEKPDKSETDFCLQFVTELAEKIYGQSDFIHRFVMKFITVLK
ncbi:MAG: transglutaminase-like domain-containing protein [Ruminococcus sp.]|nr:transglutaminase-like domain-containing protein [Ruminococcus sp.]